MADLQESTDQDITPPRHENQFHVNPFEKAEEASNLHVLPKTAVKKDYYHLLHLCVSRYCAKKHFTHIIWRILNNHLER